MKYTGRGTTCCAPTIICTSRLLQSAERLPKVKKQGRKTTHNGCCPQPRKNWSRGAFAHKRQGLYLFSCPLPPAPCPLPPASYQKLVRVGELLNAVGEVVSASTFKGAFVSRPCMYALNKLLNLWSA